MNILRGALPFVALFLTSGGSAAFAFELFPEVEGMEWHYTTTALPSDDPYDVPRKGTYVMRIEEITKSGGSTIFEIREHDSFRTRYRFSEWEVSADGVRIRDLEYPGPLSTMIEGFALEFFRFPLEAGRRFDDGQWITRVVGQEPVRIPGFDAPVPAWKLDVIGTRGTQYTAVGYYWIVPGWGIARSDLNAWGWDFVSEARDRTFTAHTAR